MFYIASVYCVSRAAEKLGGKRTYWAALILGCVWPFAFQYGRIAGWYAMTMFLLSALTWAYLAILENLGPRPWIAFSVVAVLLVWTNYFGFVFLFLLLADLLLFHKALAVTRAKWLFFTAFIIAGAFSPVFAIAVHNLAALATPFSFHLDFRNEIARFVYPAFTIFASTAVAPWFSRSACRSRWRSPVLSLRSGAVRASAGLYTLLLPCSCCKPAEK